MASIEAIKFARRIFALDIDAGPLAEGLDAAISAEARRAVADRIERACAQYPSSEPHHLIWNRVVAELREPTEPTRGGRTTEASPPDDSGSTIRPETTGAAPTPSQGEQIRHDCPYTACAGKWTSPAAQPSGAFTVTEEMWKRGAMVIRAHYPDEPMPHCLARAVLEAAAKGER